MITDHFEATLASGLGFTADELALNEQGRLSASQEAMVTKQLRRSRTMTIIAAVAIVGSVTAITAIALVTAGDNRSGAMVTGFAVFWVVVVAVFGAAVLIGHRRAADLRTRRVSNASGPASTREVRMRESQGGTTLERYELTVGESPRILLPTRKQLDAFDAGSHYVLHYLRAPGTPLVLSARRGP